MKVGKPLILHISFYDNQTKLIDELQTILYAVSYRRYDNITQVLSAITRRAIVDNIYMLWNIADEKRAYLYHMVMAVVSPTAIVILEVPEGFLIIYEDEPYETNIKD